MKYKFVLLVLLNSFDCFGGWMSYNPMTIVEC